MKIEKIAISHGLTINIEHFESERADVEMVGILDKGDNHDKEYDRLKEIVNEKLKIWEQEIRELRSNQEIVIENTNKINVETKAQTTNEKFNCPKCGEEMLKKEGKEYYHCSKHWGYPDMIKEGKIRDKKY